MIPAVAIGLALDRLCDGCVPGVPGMEAEPVLVFVIRDAASARRLRAAIRPERILWQGDPGLALEGGSVLASDLDGAGDVIEAAGWIDAPIEIVRLEPRAHGGEAPRDAAGDEARLARLRALADQPTLDRSEQIFVRRAMHDGLEL